jgi:hypothetical protein
VSTDFNFDPGDRGIDWDALPDYRLDVAADGTDLIIFGDVAAAADIGHLQGDNPFGAYGTCGLVSCEFVLRGYDIDVTETDVVRWAVDHRLCYTDGDDPTWWGATTVSDRVTLLEDFGIPAHAERRCGVTDLAEVILSDRAAIIDVNAGILWDDPSAFDTGSANHSVEVTGVSFEVSSGKVAGFYINDSGTGEFGRYIDADLMHQCWESTGGQCVVTDMPRIR